jgi:hypothetical protein
LRGASTRPRPRFSPRTNVIQPSSCIDKPQFEIDEGFQRMHIVWASGVVAIVVIVAGLGLVFARKAIAGFALYRQRNYYPGPARQVFGIQTRPTYYLVLGIVVTVVGLVVALGSLRR